MYTNVIICIDNESDIFSIKVGLHQGLALSSYVFTLTMDKITNDIK
jgi:hypothetical protein